MKDSFQFSVFSVQCLMQQGRGETNSSFHINAPKWHRRPAFAPNGVILDSDHMCENEWELLKRLTKQWIVNGTNIGNLKLILIASEVMESWEINAPEKHWNKPSIDFLFIDNLATCVYRNEKRNQYSSGCLASSVPGNSYFIPPSLPGKGGKRSQIGHTQGATPPAYAQFAIAGGVGHE